MLQRHSGCSETTTCLQFLLCCVLVAGIVLPLPSPTSALGAEPSDIVGIYWDHEGSSNTVVTTEPWQWVTGYIVVKNLSSPCGLRAIALTGRRDGPAWDFC